MRVFFLLIFSLLFADSFAANPETRSISDKGFAGALTAQSDGGLELSMGDGSFIFLGPGDRVDPRTIGKTTPPTLRRDITGRVIFAADRGMVLIYTFRFNHNHTRIFMTDPEDMVTVFDFDGVSGRIKQVLLPFGRKLLYP